jgi:hypothetical protein
MTLKFMSQFYMALLLVLITGNEVMKTPNGDDFSGMMFLTEHCEY